MNDPRRHSLATPCSVCGVPAATILLTQSDAGWHLRFESMFGSNGGGDSISGERTTAILEAFRGPEYDSVEIEAAGLYDDAGFCRPCGRFYCATHWSLSSTGGGTCPSGHFKSLDPHWHPDCEET